MALKKQHFAEGEIPIFDEACIYKRGEYWLFRMWLPKENKYASKSLRTRSEKLPSLDKGNEAIRRATLTNDEYEALYRAMRTYTAKHNKLEVKRLCKEFGFTVGMLKSLLAKGRGKK